MDVLVEFDYVAEEPDELTIKKGDIIKEVSQFEEGWFIGNLNGKVGVFPDNFVKAIEASIPQKKEVNTLVETVKEPQPDNNKNVEQDYEGNRTGSVPKTQRVTGIGLGNIFSGQPIQLKQTSLKDVIKDNESNSDKTMSTAKGDGSNLFTSTDHVRARFDYQPKQSDELELHVDDLIQVLDRNLPDEGWWKGKNLATKKIGVFPDNFVIPLQDNTAAAEADDQTRQESQRHSHSSVTPTTLNTAPDPPKIAAKPSPLFNSHPGSKSNNQANSMAQRDSAKFSVPGAHNLSSGRSSTGTSGSATGPAASAVTTTTNGSVGVVVSGSGRTNRWRTSSEHSDVSKCRPDGEPTDLGNQDAASDGNNQRLTGLTADRPKQTGRRLPSKFNRPASPPDVDDKHNENDNVKRTVPFSSSPASLNAGQPISNQTQNDGENMRSEIFEPSRGASSKTSDTNQRVQRVHITGIAKQSRVSSSHSYRSMSPAVKHTPNQKSHQTVHEQHATFSTSELDHRKSLRSERRLHNSQSSDCRSSVRGALNRSEGAGGSTDLSRSQEALASKKHDTDIQKSGTTKIPDQIEQLQNQYDHHVNETRQQMRDMRRQIELLKEANNQIRADMLQSQRIVTERIQTLMNEVDEAKKQRAADAIELSRLRTVLMQLDAKAIMMPTCLRSRTTAQSRQRNLMNDRVGDDNGMQSFYGDYDDDDISEQEKMSTHCGGMITKNGDMQHTGINKSNHTRNPISGVRPREGNPLSYARS